MKFKIEFLKNISTKIGDSLAFSLIILFNLLCFNSLYAQALVQEDLNDLINKLPLMNSYDKDNGYFKNTEYDKKVDVETIISDNYLMNQKLEEINKKIDEIDNNILLNNSNDESIWKELTKLNDRKKELINKIENNCDFILHNSEPSRLNLVSVIDKIAEDSILPIYSKDKVKFNKLPKIVSEIPMIQDKDLRRYFYSLDKSILDNYLKNAYEISLMFNKANNIVLFCDNQEKTNLNKIALLNFSKILSLHPKMSLFDFERFGFYKINKLNLSENDFNNELIKIKSKKNYIENNDITNLEDTREMLNNIETEILNLVSEYAKNHNYEVILNVSLPKITDNNNDKKNNLGIFLTQSEFYYYLYDNFDFSSIRLARRNSIKLFHWLSIVKNPLVIEVLYKENFPIFSNGGVKIDCAILESLYQKYKIENTIMSNLIYNIKSEVER